MQKLKNYLGTVIMIGCFMFSGAFCAKYGLAIEDENTGLSLIVLGGLLLSLYLIIAIHIVLHEGGHLIAGLLTGYEFVSFRIGNFAVIKGTDGRLHLKKMMVLGTAGQCLLAPPKVKTDEYPYKLYHLSGGLINIIIGLLGLLFGLAVAPKGSLAEFFLLEFAILGLGLGISNLLPFTRGVDGANLYELMHSKQARKCMYLVLEVNARLTVANSLDDIPSKLKDEITSMDFTDMDLTQVSVANLMNYPVIFCFS
ncbi:hypothetical protein P261_00184 [Lachnospiraceae bacterium TWA4]|nr:hypothetical protein P261_00184 [Lachnospiraceae bacterium TWA4]